MISSPMLNFWIKFKWRLVFKFLAQMESESTLLFVLSNSQMLVDLRKIPIAALLS